jgi:hypothetical protein
MPKIYEYLGMAFLIYINDHEPIHVHVKNGNRESIIEIIRNSAGKVIDVRKRKGVSKNDLSPTDLSTALKFVNIKAEEIINAWKLIEKGQFKEKPIIITRKIV